MVPLSLLSVRPVSRLSTAARTKLKKLQKEAAAKETAAANAAANKGPTERSPHAKEVMRLGFCNLDLLFWCVAWSRSAAGGSAPQMKKHAQGCGFLHSPY